MSGTHGRAQSYLHESRIPRYEIRPSEGMSRSADGMGVCATVSRICPLYIRYERYGSSEGGDLKVSPPVSDFDLRLQYVLMPERYER